MICPSHGVIWRNDPEQIAEKYLEWADNYQEDQISVLYDTMWQGTRKMAERIAEGIQSENDSVKVKIYNLSNTDNNDVITEVFKSRMILTGSPTINNGFLVSVAGFLEQARGLNFKNKKAAAFGSYGWSGESVKMINQRLEEAGFELINEGLRLKWDPDEKSIQKCIDYGRQLMNDIEK